jgi:hypothetical protein
MLYAPCCCTPLPMHDTHAIPAHVVFYPISVMIYMLCHASPCVYHHKGMHARLVPCYYVMRVGALLLSRVMCACPLYDMCPVSCFYHCHVLSYATFMLSMLIAPRLCCCLHHADDACAVAVPHTTSHACPICYPCSCPMSRIGIMIYILC